MVALAYRNESVHNLEHVQLLVVGLLFWAVILAPFPSLHRPNVTRKLAYLAILCVVSGAVAAVLVFDPTNVYPVPYATGTPWLGMSAITEQRLAGAVMMALDMPAALAAAVWVVSRGRITRMPSVQPDRGQPQLVLGPSPLLGSPNSH
jgi:cytochrome c oxidase assembly factor CtaG